MMGTLARQLSSYGAAFEAGRRRPATKSHRIFQFPHIPTRMAHQNEKDGVLGMQNWKNDMVDVGMCVKNFGCVVQAEELVRM